MKPTTERLVGEDCRIFTHGTGPLKMRAAATGALMGPTFRVGEDDSLHSCNYTPAIGSNHGTVQVAGDRRHNFHPTIRWHSCERFTTNLDQEH